MCKKDYMEMKDELKKLREKKAYCELELSSRRSVGAHRDADYEALKKIERRIKYIEWAIRPLY